MGNGVRQLVRKMKIREIESQQTARDLTEDHLRSKGLLLADPSTPDPTLINLHERARVCGHNSLMRSQSHHPEGRFVG